MKYGWIAVGVVAIVAVVVISYWIFQPPAPVIDPMAQACGSRPAEVPISDRQFDLAGVNVGKVAVGSLQISAKPEILSALSAASKNTLVVDYLICVAAARGDIEKGDGEQSNYLRQMLLFFQTKPTADQFSKWQTEHPFPKKVAQLSTPDFRDEQGTRVLDFRDEIYRKIRFINAGNAMLSVWLQHFPDRIFFPVPDSGPWNIAPGHSQEVTIVFTREKPDKDIYPFQIVAQGTLELPAEIRIETTAVSNYERIRQDVQQSLPMQAAAVPASELYQTIATALKNILPNLGIAPINLVAASMLTDFQSAEGAKIALMRAASEAPELSKTPSFMALERSVRDVGG